LKARSPGPGTRVKKATRKPKRKLDTQKKKILSGGATKRKKKKNLQSGKRKYRARQKKTEPDHPKRKNKGCITKAP